MRKAYLIAPPAATRRREENQPENRMDIGSQAGSQHSA